MMIEVLGVSLRVGLSVASPRCAAGFPESNAGLSEPGLNGLSGFSGYLLPFKRLS